MIQTNYRTIEKKWIQWNVNKETNKQNNKEKCLCEDIKEDIKSRKIKNM